MQHEFERKALLGAAMRVLAREGEIANLAASDEASQLAHVVFRMAGHFGQDVRVAGIGEFRNFLQHGLAQRIGRRRRGRIHRLGRSRNDADCGQPSQAALSRQIFPPL